MAPSEIFAPFSYSGLSPEYAVFGGILMICLLVYLLPGLSAGISIWVSLFSIAIAFYFSSVNQGGLIPASLELKPWSGIIRQFLCVSASVVLFGWLEWRQDRKIVFSPIFPCLLLTALLSLMVLVHASELWLMIMAAECFSFSAYALATGNPDFDNSGKNTLRYFGVGALATGISIFGFSWITGFQGANLSGDGGFADSFAFFPVAGSVLFLAFIFFKLGCFPFQTWISGIFVSAPTPVAGFLASAPKIAAGFVCLNLMEQLNVNLTFPLVLLSILTGVLGNLAAFRTRNLKEMLAFSAIGQASFLIIPAIFSRQVAGAESQLVYFSLAYGTAVQAAFSVVQYFENQLEDNLLVEDCSGLYRSNPVPAFILTGLLLSIVGLPPFAGFTAKLLVISGLPAGSNLFPSAWLYALYLTGLVNTVLAAGYFMRIPHKIFFKQPMKECSSLRPSAASVIIMLSGFIFQILLFLFPAVFLRMNL